MQDDPARRGQKTRRVAINTRSRKRAAARFGQLPWIVAAAGLGLLICSLANALSRATLDPPMLLFWLGILTISLPIFYRLTSREASTGERLALVLLLGLCLFGVKVARDAPLYTFSDELVHAFNANQIVATGHLFHENSILEVTPYYPGLEGAASALMAITGLSSYTSGVIVVGVARLLMLAALFLLFVRVSGSARTAGLGVGIYAGNFNFLYWGAQFSYESLALPLLLVVMMALAEREAAPRAALREWGVPVILAMTAILVTHHLTSYAMAGVLTALSLAYWYVHRRWRPPNPWPFALFGVALAVAWLIVVASSTVGYLTPVLGNAVEAIINTIGGEDPPRSLFQSDAPMIEPTPLPARALALLGVVILTVGLPFGLREVWRHHMKKPFALLFALAALGFFGTLALRLTPPAWETGNRASEFLFIGLAFVIACACTAALMRWRGRRLVRGVVAAAIGWLLVGGAISGWPWDSQLAQPLRIAAGERTISSPPLAMAEWAEEHVEGGRFAATNADAGLLLVPGGKFALAGTSPAIEDILDQEILVGWELPVLRRHDLRYVVTDRRENSEDGLRGYYFSRRGSATLKPRSTAAKFNQVPGASRLYTNGPITVFDLQGRR